MKLFCVGAYHNSPAGLHFDGPGVIDLDDPKAAFLLKDAPENFMSLDQAERAGVLERDKALDEPPRDKAIRSPAKKK